MNKAYVVLVVLLVVSIVSNLNLASSSTSAKVNWALLISGSNEIGLAPVRQTREPLRDCYYMFHLLTSHWSVPRDHIKFLDINPIEAQYPYGSWVPPGTIDGECRTYSDVKAAIDWLKAHSTSNDNVLIFIASHGGGYYPGMSLEQSQGRIEYSGDEGNETWDGSNWYGVDECIVFKDIGESSVKWWYWDDDLKSDLAGMSYNQLVIVLMSCFSGGFIDDLSAPNRIVITSSKETTTTYASTDITAGFTPFIGYFLDAFNGDDLHHYHAVWSSDVNNRIVDQYEITVPDEDGNGVDWRNIFAYARDQYSYDSPWFDSNGNGIPTYKDGQDYIEYFLYVWHNYGGYTTPNIGGYEYPAGTTVNIYATVNVYGYYFDHWLPDDIPIAWIHIGYYPTWNPYTYTMDKDHAISAYFYPEGGGGGGGEGCPTLFAWNGTGYVDYGVINIHNPTGEDVIREVPVLKEDMGISNYKAKFRLREGWEGLNFSESVIDQVKLYAVDSQGNRYLCPLVKAEHSRLGNVLLHLIASDDVKTQILLLETIDLTFIVPYPTIQTQSYVFVIEGCNQYKQ